MGRTWSQCSMHLSVLVAALALSACQEPDAAEVASEEGLSEVSEALGVSSALGAGSAANSSWTRFTASGTTLYAVPIVAARAVRLNALRVIAAAAGGSCRLGLYDEANGKPARLLTTANTSGLVAGTNSVSVAAELRAGSRYWVAGLCSGSAQLYRTTQTGQSFRSAFALSFFPLPTTYPSSAAVTNGTALSLYAWVEDPAPPLCTPGERRCASQQVQVCSADGNAWINQEACSLCQNGACVAPVCTPNELSCAGTIQRRCNPDGTGFSLMQQCAAACNAGQCVACTPGTAACNDPGSQRLCDATGAWVVVSCPAQMTCVNNACSGECRAGSSRCNLQTGGVDVCSATGTWTLAQICATGTHCSNGACVL